MHNKKLSHLQRFLVPWRSAIAGSPLQCKGADMERLFKLVYFAGMLAQIILGMPYERQRRLDGALLPEGDECIAKEWQRNFAEKGKVVYLAYRAGERRVDACELPTTM